MDTSFAPTVEISTPSDAPTGIVPSSESSTPAAYDWVGDAITLGVRYRHRIHRPRRQFSSYQLGVSQKPYIPPEWLTQPDPEPPLFPSKHRQPPNPLIRAAKAWYREWRRRDWEAASDFFKATDPDETPTHDIIKQA